MPGGISTWSVRSASWCPEPLHCGAWVPDQATVAAAVGAPLRANELAEGAPRDLLDAAHPVAGRARRHLRARLDAGRLAVRTRNRDTVRDLAGRPRRRFDQIDRDVGGDVRAARAAATHPRREQIVAEEGGEDVREAPEVERGRPEAAASQACVAEAVVELSRLGAREHLVGFDGLLEALLGVGRLGDVGVQLPRETAERLLDLGLARVTPNAENLVVVTFSRCHRAKRSRAPGG